ncbi:MAG: hypothetical protein HQM09_11025 [Candidatus Riflebacteria bacterium]|nr:hypothetical protein [Candidatus Riflebacteria bacterium]
MRVCEDSVLVHRFVFGRKLLQTLVTGSGILFFGLSGISMQCASAAQISAISYSDPEAVGAMEESVTTHSAIIPETSKISENTNKSETRSNPADIINPVNYISLGSETSAVSPTAAEVCLVIGQDSNPVLGEELFKKALTAWLSGKGDEARILYEKALLASRTILNHNDSGMAINLLDWYRKSVDKPGSSAELNCRLGFFENIVGGNLVDSIAHYRRAVEMATATQTRELARGEVERLSRELAFVQSYQETKRKASRRVNAYEVKTYLEKQRVESVEEHLEDLETQRDELSERLSYLEKEEGNTQEELYHDLWRANRYHRFVYVESAGYDTPENELNSYYYSRNRAREKQDQIAGIRTEIEGIKRRIKETDAEIEKVRDTLK